MPLASVFLRRLVAALLLNLLATAVTSADWPVAGLVALADDDDDDDDDDDRPLPAPRPPPPPREVIAAGLTPPQIATLQARGYQVLGVRPNAQVGQAVLLLRAPVRTQRIDPLAEVRALGRNVLADRNHLYRHQQSRAAASGPLQLAAWPAPATRCASVPIGLIDTAIDLQHPALRGAAIRTLALPGRSAASRSDTAHGTGLAALLVGTDARLPVLAPRARLIAVDAFRRGPRGEQRMEAWDLLTALDLVVGGGARVVNMSFAGAANLLLAQALRQVHGRGVVSVAAVGNLGPRAAPQYPAAYPEVIAVTAVGADRRIYPRAVRGRHVDLAAPGVGIPVATTTSASASASTTTTRHGTTLRSGTSFAAPFVTAAVAAALGERQTTPADVMQRLTASAQDLGAQGHDVVYGHGLLQAGDLCD